MSAEDFIASNGLRIVADEDLDVKIFTPAGVNTLGASPWLDEKDQAALEEYFQHRRDSRFGRWRSASHTSWTAVLDPDTNLVCFHHEDGLHEFTVDFTSRNLSAWNEGLQAIAREYFEAHPAPRPWHGAQPGEVWLLTISNPHAGRDIAWQVTDKSEFSRLGLLIHKRDPRITDGRRLWPEEAKRGR